MVDKREQRSKSSMIGMLDQSKFPHSAYVHIDSPSELWCQSHVFAINEESENHVSCAWWDHPRLLAVKSESVGRDESSDFAHHGRSLRPIEVLAG
ncbi:hypothetical protein NLX62_01350 [Mycobacteriaceae bacterium Msp059]|nr:hypothetical protein [Mycobacteriaceae bacterium Msp059]